MLAQCARGTVFAIQIGEGDGVGQSNCRSAVEFTYSNNSGDLDSGGGNFDLFSLLPKCTQIRP
jgi:hypothetical protein